VLSLSLWFDTAVSLNMRSVVDNVSNMANIAGGTLKPSSHVNLTNDLSVGRTEMNGTFHCYMMATERDKIKAGEFRSQQRYRYIFAMIDTKSMSNKNGI